MFLLTYTFIQSLLIAILTQPEIEKKKTQEIFKMLTTEIQQLLTSLSILIFPNNPRVNNKISLFPQNI